MAVKTLGENINQAISDLNGVKQALIDKGVEIPSGTKTSEYGAKIGEIEGGSGGLDTSGVTDFEYFCRNNRLAEQVDKINTSSGIIFSRMFSASDNLTVVPPLNTKNGTTFTQMFYNCTNLTEVKQLDTSNATHLSSMFYQCKNLTTIPPLDTQKVSSFDSMFYQCTNLTTIPRLDTQNGTSFHQTFYQCTNLTTIPQLDTQNGKAFYQMFSGCAKLTSLDIDMTKGTDCRAAFNGCGALTDVTLKCPPDTNWQTYQLFYNCKKLQTLNLTNLYVGSQFSNTWLNNCTALTNMNITGTIKIASDNFSVSVATKLTVESLLNVLNALSDNTGVSTTYKVTLGSTNLAKLTAEQKQIAIDKNYTLA